MLHYLGPFSKSKTNDTALRCLKGYEMEHLLHIFAGITALVTGLMAGNELAIALFAHPVLYSLPDETHTRTAKALAQRLGTVMPFWYGLTFALNAALTWRLHSVGMLSFNLVGVSSILALMMIIYTILFLVPINNRVCAWNLEELPADWKRDRQTWDKLHRWRVAVLIIGFGLLVSGLMGLPLQ